MRAIETIVTENKTLAVLVETMAGDDTKGYVSYFIDGIEVNEWEKVVKRYQRLLIALSDNLCEGLNLQKWSY